MRAGALALLLLGLAGLPGVLAAEEKASRPAAKKDLIGTWEMVSVRPAGKAEDPVFYPYQRFVFHPNASMKYMTSDRPLTKEWLEKFRKQQAEIDYSVDDRGVMTLMWQKLSHQERAICAFVLKDVPAQTLAKLPAERRKGLPKKGDLTLSFLDSQGRIAYQKVLTRIA
jgi:hypothetical protein